MALTKIWPFRCDTLKHVFLKTRACKLFPRSFASYWSWFVVWTKEWNNYLWPILFVKDILRSRRPLRLDFAQWWPWILNVNPFHAYCCLWHALESWQSKVIKLYDISLGLLNFCWSIKMSWGQNLKRLTESNHHSIMYTCVRAHHSSIYDECQKSVS